jgi:hypothetical protein
MINGFNIAQRFNANADAVVFKGDCRELLRQVPGETISIFR